jgi:2-hydroxychromene-2-carboxylate isomerase
MDPSKIFELIESDKIKNKLRKNTENLIERGGFGSPTIFINDTDMYFGNDRIELVDYKLSKLKKNS